MEWAIHPWETFLVTGDGGRQTQKLEIADPVVLGTSDIRCNSSSDLFLAQTDHLTWSLLIRLSVTISSIPIWQITSTHGYVFRFLGSILSCLSGKDPNAQEALHLVFIPEQEATEYYRLRLAACWTEAHRVLKDGGLLAFTFHHSEDAQWAVVLSSLFESGFILSRPILSPVTR